MVARVGRRVGSGWLASGQREKRVCASWAGVRERERVGRRERERVCVCFQDRLACGCILPHLVMVVAEGPHRLLVPRRLRVVHVHLRQLLVVKVCRACVVKRSKDGNVGGLWLKCHGSLVGFEVMGRFSRVPRTAPNLQRQPDDLPVASYGLTKTATLTLSGCERLPRRRGVNGSRARRCRPRRRRSGTRRS